MTSSFSLLERCLWGLSTAATILLIVKLWRERLSAKYRFFFAYLIVDAAKAVVLMALNPHHPAYGIVFVSLEPVFWLLYLLITLELYSLVLTDRNGIAVMGRRFVQVALAGAVGVAVLSTWLVDFNGPAGKSWILHYTFILDRTVVSSVVLFLFLLALFLVWFPIELSRNATAYCLGYFLYFLSKSFTLLTRNVLGESWTRPLSTATLAVCCLCLLLWLLVLNRKGEAVRVMPGGYLRPHEKDRLVGQLDSINASLLRLARK